MFAKPGYPSYGSNPSPDFDSGATNLNMQTSPSAVMPSPSAFQKPKPNIPQKKKNVDELYRMKRELEDALQAKEEAVEMKDMMAEDLLTTQEELQNKEDELEKVSKEMIILRERADALSAQVRVQGTRNSIVGKERVPIPSRESNARRDAEQMQMRRQIEELTAALAERDAKITERTSLATGSEGQLQASIQETQRRFESELQQKESQFHAHFAEEQRLRQAAEAELSRTRTQHETQLREAEQLGTTQVEEERKRAQASEVALTEQLNRMEIDSTSQQQNSQAIANYEAEIRDLRQRCNQFRKTSERLTTQVKQGGESQRDLERSEQEMRRRVEDLKGEVTALKLQLRNYRMPGQFN